MFAKADESAAMVFPVFVIPLIVWGTVAVVTLTTALTIKLHEKRKLKKAAKANTSESWCSESQQWTPEEVAFAERASNIEIQYHTARGRRPTPYPLYIPSVSDEESDRESDEGLFVMHDAIEGLPLTSDAGVAPLPLSAGLLARASSTGELPRRGSMLSDRRHSQCHSSSSIEDSVSTIPPIPMAHADNDAISVASATARTKLSQRLKRKVRPSVRFKQDTDVPDYREVLRKRRRSSMSNLRPSTTALFGSPSSGRSPAESVKTLEEIMEDEKTQRPA